MEAATSQEPMGKRETF